MLSVTIDTAVFAPPPLGADPAVVRTFVTTLLEWREAVKGKILEVYTSAHAPDLLGNCDLYPMRPHLKQLLQEAGVFEYDANTIAVVAQTLLSTARIEDVLGISDVLVEDLTLNPDCFAAHSPAALRDDAERCAVALSLAGTYFEEPQLRCHALALGSNPQGSPVQIRGMIVELDHTRHDLGALPRQPSYFEGHVSICGSVHRFLLALDEANVLRWASNAGEISTAVKVALYKKRASDGITTAWDQLPVFEVGCGFFDSLQAHHVDSGSELAPKLLRAVVETVFHENLAATHALRKGPGPNEDQRMRGKDAAWRRDVDYEYHLHYWERASGIVELGSVGTHNDFSIPECAS